MFKVGIVIQIIGVSLIGISIMLIAAFFNTSYEASKLIGISIIVIGIGYGLYLMEKKEDNNPSD